MNDEEQLNLLGIFHYVMAALIFLMGCFAMIYLLMGIVLFLAPDMPGFSSTGGLSGTGGAPVFPEMIMMKFMGAIWNYSTENGTSLRRRVRA